VKKIAVVGIITLCISIATLALVRDAQAQTDWEQSREIITVRVHGGDGYWAEYAPSWMSPD
jgi:hypothetical protein